MGEADAQPLEPSWAGLRELAVDRRAEIPVGTQLVWGLRTRIADGRLTPSQRLPGVRELAGMFEINVNTARAVYQRLEREGLIESYQGMGTFVASAPGSRPGVGELAAESARRARELGVDPRELATALYMSSETHPHVERERDRRVELRAQIAALQAALAEVESSNPSVPPPPEHRPLPAGPRLLDAKELEQVRAGLVRRLTDAQAALDARAASASAQAADATPRPLQKASSSATDGSRRAPGRKPGKQAKRSATPRSTTRPSTV
jgi:DNA-binding transcriptional regulator YhcF (GntR family)